MLSATNFWMCLAGLAYLATGVFILRTEIRGAHGLDKLIPLGSVFIAASLAAFAPEHFRGPAFVQNMVPSWLPAPAYWTHLIGCALLAAATSLALRKCERLSSTLLTLMFSLFVCMLYIPAALQHPGDRFAWTLVLRDSSFAAGACALAGLHSRATSARHSKWMILFARLVIAIAAVFFAVQHFLHPAFAPGVPLRKLSPTWLPIPSMWSYLTGAILLAAGITMALNYKSRLAAASIGALITALTICLYLPILFMAHGESEINEGINYVADTLLFAGAALALASASPPEPVGAEKRGVKLSADVLQKRNVTAKT